jgi:putative Holliday junction resolvase
MSIIALDVGTKRIGIAVCPPGMTMAMPLPPLIRTALKADLRALLSIFEERAAQIVVIGDPITLQGERGIAAEKIDLFVAELARRWSGKIVRVDERLTTAESTRALIDADVSRAKRKQLVDGMAAALLLETYVKRNPPPTAEA